MVRSTALATLALALLLPVALGCSCVQPTSFRETFCSSKTSVLAKVVARYDECPGGKCDPLDDQGRGIFYVVRVIRTLRGPKIEDGVFTMRTGVNSALCGTSLSIDRLYLFNLSFKTTNAASCPRVYYPLSSCGSQRLWKSLTSSQRRLALRGNRSCR